MIARALFAWLAAFAIFVALVSPALADEPLRPLRLWHGQRGDEEKALQLILQRWDGPPIDVLAVPYDALGSKIASAVPLGEGPDEIGRAHV